MASMCMPRENRVLSALTSFLPAVKAAAVIARARRPGRGEHPVRCGAANDGRDGGGERPSRAVRARAPGGTTRCPERVQFLAAGPRRNAHRQGAQDQHPGADAGELNGRFWGRPGCIALSETYVGKLLSNRARRRQGT
jgi:hypothetical protein